MDALRLALSVGRLHIVAIAALGTFTFGWALTGRYPWVLALVCGLDWFLVNLLNRVVDLREDRENRIVGTDFVARHRRPILILGLSVLLGSLVVSVVVTPAVAPLRLAYHALGLAYNWPLLPGCKRLKTLYFWKNTASALGFVITVFGYPLVHAWHTGTGLAPGVTAATVAVCAGFFFLFELSYEVIYDLRDAPGDAAAGVRSYAVVHGQQGAVRIVDGLIAGSVVLLGAGYAAGAVPWHLFIMVCAPLIQLAYYKLALRRGITAGDCVGITWLGAGLLLTYHVWILLDLPGSPA